MNPWKHLIHLWWAWLFIVPVLSPSLRADDAAAEKPAEKKQPPALGKFITVTSPVDEVMFGKIQNTALELQHQAQKEKRRAILVLEITPGSSQFHQVQGLAGFLTSTKVSHVTTVAWIPKRVTGNNVVLALACKEIIMHPDAELGDIGRGKRVDSLDQQFVVSLVEKRYNPKLSPALVLGMMDKQKVVLKIQRQVGLPGNETSETQIVLREELEELLESKIVILKQDRIKEAGIVGIFSGQQARALDILVAQTAESRAEIAERYGLPNEALREDATSGEERRVRLIKIEGMIEPILETFVERQIQRAVADGANLIIFEIDSGGGYLHSSESLANTIADLDPKEVHTVAYIPKMALSGAAIIALGCDEIYMHPDAITGDAGPIQLKEGGQFEHVPQKMKGPLLKSLSQLAKRKNRPPAVAMAMADRDLVVYEVTHRDTGRTWYMTDEELQKSGGQWKKGDIVAGGRDEFLTPDGQRAHELQLAEPPVADWDELKQRLGIPPNVEPIAVEATWVDSLVFLLNTGPAMALLIVAGIICLYLELHITTGLLGIISALCFALFFWSRFLGGTAGWLEVVLFFLGLACIGLEIFVIPGFGVFGISGGLLIISSLVLASQTFGDFGPETDFARMSRTVGTLGMSLGLVVVLALLMSKYLPQIPLLNQMILTPPGTPESWDPDEPRLRPQYSSEQSPTSLIEADPALFGQQGMAVSTLRPAGKAKIDDRYVDVVSEGPFIPKGTPIEVIAVDGNRVVVRQV